MPTVRRRPASKSSRGHPDEEGTSSCGPDKALPPPAGACHQVVAQKGEKACLRRLPLFAFAVESKPWVTALVFARTPLGCRRHMDARFRELQAQIQKRLLIPNSRADEARELAGIIVEAGEHRLAIVPHVISLYHHPKSRDFVDGQRPRTSLRSRMTLN